MRKLAGLLFLLVLWSVGALAQGQAPPVGYVQPVSWSAVAPNGTNALLRVDASGNLYTSGSPGLVQGPLGYLQPWAPVAMDASGNWHYLLVDPSGNLKTTSGGGGGDTITSPAGSIKVGGTSSNTTLDVVAASGASNYPLCSAISGGLPSSGICTVSVSAAQLLALNQLTNAVTLLPAQGANTIIIYDPALYAEFVCNSCTPFSSPDNFELYYGSGIGSSTAEQFGGSGFLDQSSSQYEEVPSPFWTSLTLQPQQLTVAMLKNLPLLLGTATTSLTGCTSGTCGSLFITIPYTILRIE